jgi:hypothetical protein
MPAKEKSAIWLWPKSLGPAIITPSDATYTLQRLGFRSAQTTIVFFDGIRVRRLREVIRTRKALPRKPASDNPDKPRQPVFYIAPFSSKVLVRN